MYLEAVILGLIIGVARNGRLANLFDVRFKGWILSILAFILFLLPYLLLALDIGVERMQIFPYAAMVLIAIISLLNFEKMGMKIFMVGLLLNLIVMGLSDFKMPIDAAKMSALGFTSFIESMSSGDVVNYVALEDAHGLGAFLGKIIALPKVYPLARVISVGDIIVSIGIAYIIQYEMLLSSLKSRGSMVQFSYNTKLRRKR